MDTLTFNFSHRVQLSKYSGQSVLYDKYNILYLYIPNLIQKNKINKVTISDTAIQSLFLNFVHKLEHSELASLKNHCTVDKITN